MKKAEVKERAFELRRTGHSYSEISTLCRITKSTAQLWTHKVEITKEGKSRIKAISDNGRKKAGEVHRARKIKTETEAREWARNKVSEINFNSSLMQILLACIYYCEGAKDTGSGLIFTNSDPMMMKGFVNMLEKSFGVDRRLMRIAMHLHSYHDEKEMKKFWGESLGLHPSQFNKTFWKKESGITIHKGYKGCVNVRIGGAIRARQIVALAQEVLSKL